MLFCNCSMFCYALLCVHSCFAIILAGKRELFALLSLSSWYLVIAVLLFLVVPWVCLQFVIVVFPDQTYLLILDPDQSGSKLFAKDIIRRQISLTAKQLLNKAVNKSRLSSARIL